MAEAVLTEAVEACPYCEGENVFPNYDAKKDGYIVVCQQCGRQIFLCDECLHADDNPTQKCDWRQLENGCGQCFRGIAKGGAV